jgi:hypothetical protein
VAEHPNVTVVRKGLEGFASGDMAALDTAFADDVTFHQCGNHPLSGDFAGKQAVFQHFGELGALVAGDMKMEPHDYVGNDDHVVALFSFQAGRPDGRRYADRTVAVFHVEEEKVKEMWAFEYDQEAQNVFFRD